MLLAVLLLVSQPSIPFEKYTLQNGLEVILHVDRRLPIVAVNVVYHVGAVDEPRHRTGFAHLFEHLMFQGSKHVDQHIALVENAGSLSLNGFTDFDYTEYIETLPSAELDLALWLESDRMGFLLDALDQPKLDNQREVVKNERRQNFDDTPYGLVEEAILKAAYPKSHPYSDGIIGSMQHLDSATLADAKVFFERHYAPSNATITIAGDFDEAHTKNTIERYFGTLPTKPKPPRTKPTFPAAPTTQRVELKEAFGALPQLSIAFVTPPALAADDAEIDMWAEILGGGKGSRLHQALVAEGIAESVSADVESLQGGSLLQLTITALTPNDATSFEQQVQKVLRDAIDKPITEAELRRTKAKWETGYLQLLESVGGESGKANVLQLYNHYAGDPGAFAGDMERHRKIDLAGMQAAGKKWLTAARQVTVVSLPTPSARAPTQAATPPQSKKREVIADPNDPEAFRLQRPPRTTEKELTPGKLERATLANGLTVFVAESHALPLVSVSAVFKLGVGDDPIAAPGLVGVLVDWMDEGAGERDASALSDAFADLGADLNARASTDASVFRTTVTTEHTGAATALIADILQRPHFTEAAFAGVIERHVAAVIDVESSPFNLAVLKTHEHVFGSAHPYGHAANGTKRSLEKLTAARVRNTFKDGVGANNTALVFSGDITLAEATKLAEQSFGAWTAKSSPRKTIKVTPRLARAPSMYEKQNIGQTTIALGAQAVDRKHADGAPLRLLADIFGGLFHSRLNMRLREELGITYGAYADLDRMRAGGVWLVGTSVRADATLQAQKETLAMLAELRSKPVSATELTAAKNAVLKSLPGLYEHVAGVGELAEDLFVYDLPLDWIAQGHKHIQAVTTADLQRVAKKYLSADKVHVVLVGDKRSFSNHP